jgi:hypothetical protein
VTAAPVTIDAMTCETVEKKTGTIVLTTTPDGWEIVGVSKIRGRIGKRPTFTFRATRCDCRTNPESTNRVGVRNYKYSTYSNIGTRELCPKPVEHNRSCHNRHDHCKSWGHEVKVRALFDAVVKSYR